MRDLLGKLNRLQQSTGFKIAASVIVTLAIVGGFIKYAVDVAAERQNLPIQEVAGEGIDAAAREMTPTEGMDAAKADEARKETAKVLRERSESMANTMNALIERRLSVTAFAIGAAIVAAIMLVIIWLGLALTFLAIAGVVLAACLPMWRFGSPAWQGVATFIAGVLALGWSFTALVQAARLLLKPTGPIAAVAQNVINEAVRMKISLVFIVMLILAMAALPGALDAGSPLRYRVQAFISYGCESAFWIIAVLVLFLSCATVAFEQRDKTIWQTMTKPVKAWQYLLGKWLGVTLMAGILLGVSSAGVFLFTEYLRMQPAQGEVRPFLPAAWQEGESITQDRLILETQVLTARQSVPPAFPELLEGAIEADVTARLERMRQSNPSYQDNADNRTQIRTEIEKEISAHRMAVEPGKRTQFVFLGLNYAKETNAPITLRFKVNAGGNMPTDTYRVTFLTPGTPPMVLETRLDQFLSEPLPPLALQEVNIPGRGREWALVLDVWNGDLLRGAANPQTMTFPVGGLEVSYPVSGFRGNYLRAVLMMWLKLAFLAMVGICAATFLSFPVAALLAFGVFLCAEGAGFLTEALNSYTVQDQQDFLWWRIPIVAVAESVAFIFSFYSRLQPVQNLAEGRVVTWLNVLTATVILGGLTAGLWAISSFIFRRRELATYSGN